MSAADRMTSLRAIRATAWIVGVLGALVQAVVYRVWVNADSTSYLDMSDAVLTGDWHRLVNATWSPLYPALIGLARLPYRTPAWDFPSAHLVNFLSFLFAFATFELLLRALLDASEARARETGGEALPRAALAAVGYALFLWASLGMLSLMKPTPDMLMSGLLYLAVWLLVRIGAGRDDARTLALFGIVLGVGYLAKAIMFPLGVVMIGMTLLMRGTVSQRLTRAAIAGGAMLLVAAPYVAAVSARAGHPTFGDAGKVVHLTFVDRATPPGIWAQLNDASGQPVRPARQIHAKPATFAYPASNLSVTRSVWFDPALSAQGLRTGFNVRSQVDVLRANVGVYLRVILELATLLVVLAMVVVAVRGRGTLETLLAHWTVWGTAVVALAAYALIHVETRYIGMLFALIWLGVLCGVRLTRPIAPSLVRGLTAAVVVNLVLVTGWYAARDYRDNRTKTRLGDLEAGLALNALGVGPEAHVARINDVVADGWARLGRVNIVAEVLRSQAGAFWKASPEVQRSVLDSLAATGARAAVAHVRRAYGALPAGWTPLGRSEYAVHLLSPPQVGAR